MIGMFRYKNLLVSLCALFVASVSMLGAASAQAVTQAYSTDMPLQRGMIVRVSEKDKSKVEPLVADSILKMEGVVVAANDAPVTLSDETGSTQQVFVATTGKYNVLVSNQNGVIKSGDPVTISSLAGIGMAASDKQSLIVGKALSDFDGKSQVSGTSTLKGPDGKDITVKLALIGVDINISRNPREASKDRQVIPVLAFLQSGANAVANKTVDPARLYIGVLILFLSMALAGSILYAGVRSSIVSIGRNPLAKSSIVRNLVQIILVSIIILIIGMLGVYLILKL